MPKKVVLHGDPLGLLYDFLDCSQMPGVSDQLADLLNYHHDAFRERAAALQNQIRDGRKVEWDNLEQELAKQAAEEE